MKKVVKLSVKLKSIISFWIIISALLLTTLNFANAQPTFNKFSELGYEGAFLNGVVATDSCYYGIAEVFEKIAYGAYVGLVKYDLQGNPVSVGALKDSFGLFSELKYILATGADGTFAVSGFATTFDPVRYDRIFFVRFAHDGKIVAYKDYTNPTMGFTNRDIAATPDSGYVMTWQRYRGGIDTRLVKVDKMGVIQWQQDYDKGGAEEPNIVRVDTDGGIISGGTYGNIGLPSSNPVGRNYIFKVDTVGNVLWEYLSDPDSLNIKTNEILSMPDGGWAYATHRGESYQTSMGVNIRHQGAIVKLDSNRNEEWEILLGKKGGYEKSTVIVATDDGSIIAGGNGLQTDNTPPLTEFEAVRLTKISPNGDIDWVRWIKYAENSLFHDCRGIDITSDGGIIFGGRAEIKHFPGWDAGAWLVKTDSLGCVVPGCHLNVSVDDVKEVPVIKTYPNPVSDMLYVYIYDPLRREVTFSLITLQGQTVKTFSGRESDMTWMVPMHGLAAGVYLLRAEVEGAMVFSKKVVKGN